jgi:hypothetical protein
MKFGRYSFSDEAMEWFKENGREVAEKDERFVGVPSEIWDLIYPEKEAAKKAKK